MGRCAQCATVESSMPSAAATTLNALTTRAAADAALARKTRRARLGDDDEAWTRRDVRRVDAVMKCALATVAGVGFGVAGVVGLGVGIWGLFFAYFVSQMYEMRVMKVDIDQFGDPVEFVLNGLATQTFLMATAWTTVGALTGKLPQR